MLLTAVLLYMLLQALAQLGEARDRAYHCADGYCAMAACRNRSGSTRSLYCYIAADSSGKWLTCREDHQCRGAARSWGNCVIFSCAFFRAPKPTETKRYKCIVHNGRKMRDLMNSCSHNHNTFDTWANRYGTARALYDQFMDCRGHRREDKARQVIRFCLCYNFCGPNQYRQGCVVDGLPSGRFKNLDVDLFKTYEAVCKIDCKPKDKYEVIDRLTNRLSSQSPPAIQVTTITEGTTSSVATSRGGSVSHNVNAKLSLKIKEVFTGELGYSGTTETNWAQTSSQSYRNEHSTQVRVPVKGGESVVVKQVVGVCRLKDGGPTYTVKTRHLVLEYYNKDGQKKSEKRIEADGS